LGDREDVRFVERSVQRRPAVPARAEYDTLRRIVRVDPARVILMRQRLDVYELAFRRPPSRMRANRHHATPRSRHLVEDASGVTCQRSRQSSRTERADGNRPTVGQLRIDIFYHPAGLRYASPTRSWQSI